MCNKYVTSVTKGTASQQSMLTPPETCPCPISDLHFFLIFWPFSHELFMFPDFEFRASFGTSIIASIIFINAVISLL